MTPSSSNGEALVAQMPSLRRLAIALVGADRSDDLVQEAALSALREGEISSRAGLFAILRRRAIDSMRRAGARPSVEWTEQPDAAGVEPAQSAERLESMSMLVAAVGRLPGPQREVVVLRYFDGCPPREIARRLGLEPSTVRSRLQRGLEGLRTELSKGGGGEDWRAVALAIAGAGPVSRAGKWGGSSAALPAVLAAALKPGALVLVAAASLALVVPLLGGSVPDPGSTLQGAEARVAAASQGMPIDAVDPAMTRSSGDGEEERAVRSTGAGSSAQSGAVTIAGVVCLLDGTPVGPGVRIVGIPVDLSEDTEGVLAGETDNEGRFQFPEVPASAMWLEARLLGDQQSTRVGPVAPGDHGVEIRVDALVLRVTGHPERTSGISQCVATWGSADRGAESTSLLTGARESLTVAAGPGYIVSVFQGGEGTYGVLEPGLPSGVHDVTLEARHGRLGAMEVIVTGDALTPPERVTVTLLPRGSDVRPEQSAQVLARQDGHGRTRLARYGASGFLPGLYDLAVQVHGPPTNRVPLTGTVQPGVVRLSAGEVNVVEVELRGGAGVEVSIEPQLARADPVVADGGAALVYSLERYDDATARWGEVPLKRSTELGWITAKTVPIGQAQSRDALPPGPTRFRLLERGEVVAETEATLLEGSITHLSFHPW